MKVICDSRKYCKERYTCGATISHEYDENECGKCPIDPSAKCICLNNEKEEENKNV